MLHKKGKINPTITPPTNERFLFNVFSFNFDKVMPYCVAYIQHVNQKERTIPTTKP